MDSNQKILIFTAPNEFCIPAVKSLEKTNYKLEMPIVHGKGEIYNSEMYDVGFENIKKHYYRIQKVSNISDLYNQDVFYDFADKLLQENNYEYIFPISSELLNQSLAKLNSKYNLMGINTSHLPLLNKLGYYEVMEQLKMPLPEKLDVNTDTFPVIVKPSNGSGGVGTKILYNQKELDNWFSIGDHHPNSHLQEFDNGKKRHPEYISVGGEYIIQKYISSHLVTIFGRVYDNEVYFDILFDVRVTQPPYCAEVEYSYPSKIDPKLQNKIYKKCQLFLQHIRLDNSPFLFDVLIDGNNFYFIDFGMRISTTPQPAIHAINPNYTKDWVTSFLNRKKYKPTFKKACVYRRPLLSSGIIKKFNCSETNLLHSYKLPKAGTRILLPRNDIAIFPNGFLMAVGKNTKDLYDLLDRIEESFIVEYENGS